MNPAQPIRKFTTSSPRQNQKTNPVPPLPAPAAAFTPPKPDYSKPYRESGKNPTPKKDAEKDSGSSLSFIEQQDLRNILINIGKLLAMMQIYKFDHPIVRQRLSGLNLEINKEISRAGRLVLSIRDDVMFLNGYQEKLSTGPFQKLRDTLKFLKVSSFEFEKGITEAEVTAFFQLLAAQKKEKVAGDIKDQLQKAGVNHIRPIFLQYIEVSTLSKDVPRPKNVVAGIKHGLKKGAGNRFQEQEQQLRDFLKGKEDSAPQKMNSFLMSHPKLAALAVVNLLDEYESQNLDSFNAFQAYVQSLSHYMARISRLVKDPDKVAKAMEKLEKHLVVRLKSLDKDKKYIAEVRKQFKEGKSLVLIEQMLADYSKSKQNLETREGDIIEAIEKRRVPDIAKLKERLAESGLFHSKLAKYLDSLKG